MESMLNNLENGNLKDAKRQARRFSQQSIYNYLRAQDWEVTKALGTAAYLKGQMTWEQYCAIK